MIFNRPLLEATISATRVTLRMCPRCVYKFRIVLDCHALYLQHFIDQWKLLVYKLN